MGADGRDRGAHGRARRRRGAAGHGDGVLRARPGARDGARGARRHPPRDRRARLRHAGAHHRGGDRRAAGGGDALLPRGGHPRAARGGRRRADAHAAAWTSPPSACSWPTAPSRSCSSPSSRPASPATRSSTPTPASRSTSRPSAGSARRRSRCRCARSSASASPLEDLEARLSERTKLVILNSPQNPTGGVTPAADLAAAAAAHPRDAGLGAHRRGLRAADLRRRLRLDRRACPGCSSAPSCSTASRRPTR